MKKVLKEEQFRNIVRTIVKESLEDEGWNDYMNDEEEEPGLADEEMGAAHDSDLEEANDWFASLPITRKLEAVGIADKYFQMGRTDAVNRQIENGYTDEMDEDAEYSWDDLDDDEKIRIYQKSKKNINESKTKKHMKKTLNEAQLRTLVRKMVKESLEDAMPEAGNEEGNGFDPEFVANSLIEEIEDFLQDKSPNTRSMRMAIDPERLEKAKEDNTSLVSWVEHTAQKHGFTDLDEILDYILGSLKDGGLPSASFAKNFFTKEARDRYFSKNDMSHHNDKIKAQELENDPTRSRVPRQGRYMARKIEKMQAPAGLDPQSLSEAIAKRIVNQLKNL